MTGRERQQQIEARRLRRNIIASLIAVKGHLDTPYPDDPRWTPWTRFIERTLRDVDELGALAARLSGLQDTLAEALPESPFKSKGETLAEMISFADALDPNIGPVFGRDAARVLRAVAAALAACPASEEGS